MAVGEIGGLAEDRRDAALFIPTQDAIVGNVAAQQQAQVAEPHGTLGPAQPGRESLDARELQAILLEARIEHFDRGIGITGRGRPTRIGGIDAHGLRHSWRWGCICGILPRLTKVNGTENRMQRAMLLALALALSAPASAQDAKAWLEAQGLAATETQAYQDLEIVIAHPKDA